MKNGNESQMPGRSQNSAGESLFFVQKADTGTLVSMTAFIMRHASLRRFSVFCCGGRTRCSRLSRPSSARRHPPTRLFGAWRQMRGAPRSRLRPASHRKEARRPDHDSALEEHSYRRRQIHADGIIDCGGLVFQGPVDSDLKQCLFHTPTFTLHWFLICLCFTIKWPSASIAENRDLRISISPNAPVDFPG